MIPSPSTLTTANGAVVGIYEYGDPAGRPVMVFHGVPACGAGFMFTDDPARVAGLRLIAPDRPGVGLSSPSNAWVVSSYPEMVADLADTLGVQRFAVWGYSGGGPYAVACGALLAEHVTRVAVTSGMGEVGAWAEDDDFAKTDRSLLDMARKTPRLARALLTVTARLARISPKSALESFAKELSAADLEVLADYDDPAEAMALFTNAFLNGARGVVDDYRAVGQPWGVDFAAIQAPVKIFHGNDDTMVPLRHAEELARRIPNAELVVWPGEGHLATLTHVTEILEWIGHE